MIYVGFDQFYGLADSGVPGKCVKPPNKGVYMKAFIQSTSQGARCVKPGDAILYKVRTNLAK